MRKSWPIRHPFLTTILIYTLLFGTGILLGILVNPFYFLLALPGLLTIYIGFVITDKCIWICSKCDKKEEWEREKYCKNCGGEMTLERAKVLRKYCENGHRIEDDYNLVNFCPKCGKPFKQEKIELK